ncbi:MAG: hypothetical protein Q4A03_06485 [Rothia sp. (in: high G+C Gram-positive bacteria)]|uniref:hypothetical protein n=1 Tax=Rothia sp. (in: high G+C Gram-positive bacteria) TaxID=1885016 RepID=UPI0026FD87FA|nr:hypothetical protein [Rothia sp. (in: high G+C Gram-positive bacteria)]
MKNISKALAIISIAVALTLSFSPARAASLPRNIDAHISSTSAANASPYLLRLALQNRDNRDM